MDRYTSYVALLLLTLCSTGAMAQSNGDRAGTWDFGILIMDQSAETLTGEQGATLAIKGDVGWGLTTGYHFNNRLALMFDMTWTQPDYQATRILEGTLFPNTINSKLDILTYQLKGVFHLLEGPFTPFVEASAGWTTLDSNIADGPPTTGCWYDPWWGYTCDTFFSTYSKTRFSYGAAAGLRFDTRGGIGIKASYGIQEIDTSNATESASFDTWRMDILWRF